MKDYYGILGVIRTTEDIVIKAAYRALAQKYHPDKFDGPQDEAQQRMQEINEAYAVLSDPEKRKEYDQTYTFETSESTEDVSNTSPIGEVEQTWTEVIDYFPDLVELANDLGKISQLLVQTFKYSLIESKEFEKRKEIAKNIERSYLESYFGSNEKIRNFGRLLILCKFKAAAKKLNRAISILGSKIDPNVVINKIFLDDLSSNQKVFLKLIENKDLYYAKEHANKVLVKDVDPFYIRIYLGEFKGKLLQSGKSGNEIYRVNIDEYNTDAMTTAEAIEMCRNLALIAK